jgi:hypothetical protein
MRFVPVVFAVGEFILGVVNYPAGIFIPLVASAVDEKGRGQRNPVFDSFGS